MGFIRTQINNDGTTTIWNTERDSKDYDVYRTVCNSTGVSRVKLARLIALREFNRLSDRVKLLATDASVADHVPGEKGNCLAF